MTDEALATKTILALKAELASRDETIRALGEQVIDLKRELASKSMPLPAQMETLLGRIELAEEALRLVRKAVPIQFGDDNKPIKK